MVARVRTDLISAIAFPQRPKITVPYRNMCRFNSGVSPDPREWDSPRRSLAIMCLTCVTVLLQERAPHEVRLLLADRVRSISASVVTGCLTPP